MTAKEIIRFQAIKKSNTILFVYKIIVVPLWQPNHTTMKLSREYLIERAFELYLTCGYSGVSVSVLQDKLGIGRASMYYYFNDKDDLFKAVIDRYFFDVTKQSLELPANITLKEMISTRLEALKNIKLAIEATGNKELNMSNLTALLLVAISIYPDCMEKARELKRLSVEKWKVAIQNSMQQGEIRKDIDINALAMLFSNIKDAHESFVHLIPSNCDTDSEQAYRCIYNLIKA